MVEAAGVADDAVMTQATDQTAGMDGMETTDRTIETETTEIGIDDQEEVVVEAEGAIPLIARRHLKDRMTVGEDVINTK